ncbi:MAG: S-layer homology domain-containing protein [Oscillibacter sp.]|nr:S-layer homology domain-containing protein [Oscillibacter sp.]
MKKLTVLFFITVACLLLPTVVFASSFKDVDNGAYYTKAVTWAVSKGVTDGFSDSTFRPDATCTRGQVVTFIWRVNGKPEPKQTANPFSDVNPASPFYKAILWACEKGITNGTSPTTFNPSGTCTRGQIVTFIWRANGQPSASGSSTLAAEYDSGAYYTNAVAWADNLGLLGGTGTPFKPGDACPRSDVVTYLYRNTSDGASNRSKAYTPDFDKWTGVWDWYHSSTFQKQNGVLVIDNPSPNAAWFGQEVSVKPHTNYMLRAQVKMDNYALGINRVDAGAAGGSTIGIGTAQDSQVYQVDYVNSTEWKESRILFNSQDSKTVKLRASNGGNGVEVKGTAYIKDIVLEELKTDNQWNVLALIYRNVDTGTLKNSFSTDDIDTIQDTLRNFPEDVRGLSNGRMLIGKLDTVIIDEPIRTLSSEDMNPTKGPGQDIDFDYLLEGKDYNQIVIYVPIKGASWGGLGGTAYTYRMKAIWVCTINHIEYRDIYQTYVRNGRSYNPKNLPWILHEVLHCVESNSRERGVTDFVEVHSRMDKAHSQYTTGYEEQPYSWLDWYSDLMRDTVKGGGHGFSPDSFLVSHLPT